MFIYIYMYIHCGRTQECSKDLLVFAFFKYWIKVSQLRIKLVFVYIFIYVFDIYVYWAVSGESVV